MSFSNGSCYNLKASNFESDSENGIQDVTKKNTSNNSESNSTSSPIPKQAHKPLYSWDHHHSKFPLSHPLSSSQQLPKKEKNSSQTSIFYEPHLTLSFSALRTPSSAQNSPKINVKQSNFSKSQSIKLSESLSSSTPSDISDDPEGPIPLKVGLNFIKSPAKSSTANSTISKKNENFQLNKQSPIIVFDQNQSEPSTPQSQIPKSTHFNINLKDLQCLAPYHWVTDAVINSYIKYISEKYPDPSIGFTNTFFLPKLIRDGPEAATKWTGKVVNFSQFLIPVQNGTHWILFDINFSKGELQCLDSFGHGNQKFSRIINDFIKSQGNEVLKIKKLDVPKQLNSDDCGIFLLQYVKCIFQHINFSSFRQKDIKTIRNLIKCDLIAEIKKECCT